MDELSGEIIGNYTIARKLGSGSFASVYLANHNLTGSKVAIKVIHKKSINSPDAVTRFNRECAILKQMDHPFIASLFEIIEDDHSFYLVLEFCEHGNMLDYVNTNGRLNENKARHYFCQLVSALDYIHNQKYIAHRDLKAENVLLDANDNIRLIDFGLSNVFTRETPEFKTVCGSPAYASPEMIQGLPYTKAADMWSAGILLYAMVVGRLPYDDPNISVILQKIVSEEVKYPSFLSHSLTDLLKRLLTKNPDHRITLSRLKEHPWFSQSQYQAILDFNYYGGPIVANDNQFSNRVIDPLIVNHMVSLGIDVRNLPSALISGELNQLTAIYKELHKEKSTEQMKNLITIMSKSAQQIPNAHMPLFPMAKPPMRPMPQPFPTMQPTPQPNMYQMMPPMAQIGGYQPMQMAMPMQSYFAQSPQNPQVLAVPPARYNRRMSRPTILKQSSPLSPPQQVQSVYI